MIGCARSDGRARLMDELLAEHAAPDAARLAAIGPDVDRLLVEIAEDETAPPLARNRALAAMRQFPTERTRALLERMARGGAPYARRIASQSLRP